MIKRLVIAAAVVMATASFAPAQEVDDLNIQVHGYVTQGFVYTTHNNWNTTDSTDGSPAWSEAVVNVSAQPDPRLHIAVQGRYFLLGTLTNQITLDWAQFDYKRNDYFGVRAGKVKTPMGIFNETQDIDPAQLWILLPQSIYPLASRNSDLSIYGGVAYGSVRMGGHMGKLQYRAFGGERVLASNDGYFQNLRDAGLTVPNGISGKTGGGSARWETPVRGLMVGASERSGRLNGAIMAGPDSGTIKLSQYRQTWYFAKYEKDRLSLTAEASRVQVKVDLDLTGLPPSFFLIDDHAFYVMGSWRITSKLSGGLYFGSTVDHKADYGDARYAKDWALAARYDFNSFLYAKVEQHWIDGTDIAFYAVNNDNIQPNTKMTLLKMGVSF
ncbi:MAG TPA: hypothetical protein VGU46_12920 [Acidobacteriaceae bacterium]|nr:hypothetical protein [Acidobacteriaceae bacterium]